MANIINTALSDWKSLLKLIGIIGGIILFVIIIALLLRPREHSFNQVENILKNAAIAYYEENNLLLPTEDNTPVRVDATHLIENKYMRPLTRLLPRNTCSAYVMVHYNENNHLYLPFLDCGEAFKTEMLIDAILKETVTHGDGLYEVNNEFIFRGEKINNYVLFADILWRVVKIDENRNIRLIAADILKDERGRDIVRVVWDDRYNIEEQANRGVNDYRISRIRHILNNDIIDNLNEHLNQLVYFQGCIGRRTRDNRTSDGSVECSLLDVPSKISVLSLNEYIFASLDPTCRSAEDFQCQNYNYLALFRDRWWTLTGDRATTHRVYGVSARGVINADRASDKAQVRPVILLNRFVLLQEGEGTRENPFSVR